MGLIRTPRPLYQDGFVMEFYVKEKQVMFNQALQNFSSGSMK